eukprot:CAMPEP_0196578598 /NCGR_PEP_ID=MMETSP1081-20130531/7470_1 /TAXON_ID=36882 /ORGANISM="Pyramimonas amylifera, Strain CCMP720" /LENGTH=390 /DNA_ID=CAMNT_0041897867 /DNA_START=203 /DNA_END=1376 /DNA_ORIENTATION=+
MFGYDVSFRIANSNLRHKNLSVAAKSYGDYSEAFTNVSSPGLTEIDWDVSLSNCLHIIGNVGRDVTLQQLSSGSRVARTTLAVRRGSKSDVTDWFELEFWNEEADLAVQHVSKGVRLHVEGRVKIDTWDDKLTGQKRSKCKITVRNMHHVRSTLPNEVGSYNAPDTSQSNWANQGGTDWAPVTPPPPVLNDWQATSPPQGFQTRPPPTPRPVTPPAPTPTPFQNTGNVNDKEAQWMSVISSPEKWWDNRLNKRNVKGPDFSAKEENAQGEKPALWLSSKDTPSWVAGKLAGKDAVKEDMWMDLFNNTENWWDNRSTKTNPKSPDFSSKAKDPQGNSPALWISSNDTPGWVAGKLLELDGAKSNDASPPTAGKPFYQTFNDDYDEQDEPPF